MNILETYQSNTFENIQDSDYCVFKVNDEVYVGHDNENVLSVIIISNQPNIDKFSQRTKLISIETNKTLSYKYGNVTKEGIFHVLQCFAEGKREKEVFLKLCDIYFYDTHVSTDQMCTIFMTLVDFFSKRTTYSREELQGLYGELYTIYHFKDQIDLSSCWQSKDNLKFDFSIDSKKKLEIKTTLKNERIHKFNHEQLAAKIFDVYILSYKLRYDDCGLSLEKLINECMKILEKYPNKIKKLYKILYECSERELSDHVYSEEFTLESMKLFNAKDVPHFNDAEGVSNAIYNSDFENVDDLSIEEFLVIIKNNETSNGLLNRS